MSTAALNAADPTADFTGESIHVRGLVQGVGFRPAVWRMANELSLRGQVRNDANGVCIQVWGDPVAVNRFAAALENRAPPLARVDAVERSALDEECSFDNFVIAASAAGNPATGIVADAATCAECRAETLDPFSRRYRYPFTNCTNCGPRFSIVEGIPYDRSNTSMQDFDMCAECAAEYRSAANRRFHAQPIACHRCGPRAWLARGDGHVLCVDSLTQLDDVDAVCTLLQRGEIVAIKGIGGFHLACDATQDDAVRTLREKKVRLGKPFALMARDLEIITRYCHVSDAERALLESPAAPIVVLDANGAHEVSKGVAPGQPGLGFMLPYTPLHALMLRRMDRPVVMTSGNRAEEPQCTDNDEAVERLGGIAEYFLLHDRPIVNRLDDSVVRVMAGESRVLRGARGLAPWRVPLPEEFSDQARVLAMGGELKSTFCLVAGGAATLSQHLGDLAEARTLADYGRQLELYRDLFRHEPATIAVDGHPEYLSSKLGHELAAREGIPVVQVQHHHAHVAACLAENRVALNAPPVLGVALDGLGYGNEGELWGGEFLLADYRGFERLGTFRPVPMPGGEACIREPWRSTYAQLMAEMGWPRFWMDYQELDLARFLEAKPRASLDAMIRDARFSPVASSCGRLFDAVAAASGLCRDRSRYEGEAAMALETAVDRHALDHEPPTLDYPFAIPRLGGSGLPYIEPLAMWQALLGDLVLGTPVGVIAARFHRGLARAIAAMVQRLAGRDGDAPAFSAVALTGGVFQNRTLLELVIPRIEALDLNVLTHRRVPCNDGGIALGQAAIAAAAAPEPLSGQRPCA